MDIGPVRGRPSTIGVAPTPHDHGGVIELARDARPLWSLKDLLQVVDHLPAMVAYWDQDLRNRFANTAYVEWFGRSPEQMRGMHIRDLLGERVYALNLPYIEGALRGEVQLFERVLVDAHGVTRHTQAHYIPNHADGRPSGFFVLVADITARVQAEEQLRKREAELARLRERQRLAEDLHDVVIQRLFAVGLDLEAAARAEPAEARPRIEAALDGISDALTELRATISSLKHGVTCDDITDWLDRRVRDVSRTCGITPTVTVVGSAADVPADVRGEVLAVINEALSNATKHAAATEIEVHMTIEADRLTLDVGDNGRGLTPTQRSSGLANMRDRAERLGGAFAISPRVPRGTLVRWEVPLPRP